MRTAAATVSATPAVRWARPFESDAVGDVVVGRQLGGVRGEVVLVERPIGDAAFRGNVLHFPVEVDGRPGLRGHGDGNWRGQGAVGAAIGKQGAVIDARVARGPPCGLFDGVVLREGLHGCRIDGGRRAGGGDDLPNAGHHPDGLLGGYDRGARVLENGRVQEFIALRRHLPFSTPRVSRSSPRTDGRMGMPLMALQANSVWAKPVNMQESVPSSCSGRLCRDGRIARRLAP